MGGHKPSEKKNGNGKKNGKAPKPKNQTPEDPKTNRPRGEPAQKRYIVR